LPEVKLQKSVGEECHLGGGANAAVLEPLITQHRAGRGCAVTPVDAVKAHGADQKRLSFVYYLDTKNGVALAVFAEACHEVALIPLMLGIETVEVYSHLGVVDPPHKKRYVRLKERAQDAAREG